MTRRIAIAAVVVFTFAAQPLLADFHDVAVGLRKLGFERTWIPFFGVARSLVRAVRPRGVRDIQVAIYENTPAVTGAAIEQMLQRHVGRGFTPLVRVFSARKGESVFVYARPARDLRTVELIVLTHERNETMLMRLAADAEAIGREISMPSKMGQLASH